MRQDQGWLDVAGFLEGTLKSSVWVDILRHYERHLAPFLDADIEILEIGVNTGSSLAIWQQFFSKAKFIGVDIDPNCRRFAGERVTIEIGSQDDPRFLLDLVQRYRPTIIIDDGSHLGHHIPFTFERLFPALPPGGLYVIEDMFFHLEPKPNGWLGHAEQLPHEYLGELVRLIYTEHPAPAINHGMNAYLRAQIDEIAFAPLGVAFIRKRPVPVDLDRRIAMAHAYAQEQNRGDVWMRLADYLHRNGAPRDQAEAAARKAVSMMPGNWETHRMLGIVLEAKGDLDGAVAAVEKCATLLPHHWPSWTNLGRLRSARKDFVGAEEAYRKAADLQPHNEQIRNQLNAAIAAQGFR
jgi:hypothetical protein